MKLKILQTRYPYKGKKFHVRERTFAGPGGKPITKTVIGHPRASAILCVDDERRVLLIRQFRFTIEKPTWEIPAGTVDPGESPLRCAYRELEEETGWRAKKLEKLGMVMPSPGFVDEKVHLYLATRLMKGRPRDIDGELILGVRWTSWRDCMRMICRGVICDGKSLAALQLYELKSGKKWRC